MHLSKHHRMIDVIFCLVKTLQLAKFFSIRICNHWILIKLRLVTLHSINSRKWVTSWFVSKLIASLSSFDFTYVITDTSIFELILKIYCATDIYSIDNITVESSSLSISSKYNSSKVLHKDVGREPCKRSRCSRNSINCLLWLINMWIKTSGVARLFLLDEPAEK